MPKVHIARCEDYDPTAVRSAVDECLEGIDGVGDVLRPGSTVMVKPNLVRPTDPGRAICTHPVVTAAVAEAVRDAGATALVADQPCYTMSSNADGAFEEAGISALCRRVGVETRLLKAGGYVQMDVERPLQMPSFFAAKLVFEADAIINVGKLKTHGQTLYTGAIKNMFGAIAGRSRITMHGYGDPRLLSNSIADAFSCMVPDISILDGVVGMEGNGPMVGRPRFLGAILASRDSVALDAVAERLIGFRPGLCRVTVAAAELGCGERDLSRIAISGTDPAELRTRFRLPALPVRSFPPCLLTLATRFIYVRPRVIEARCTGCGGCRTVCPGEAVSVDGVATIDYSKCIECFCCQEACPSDAIRTARSLLTRIIPQWRQPDREDGEGLEGDAGGRGDESGGAKLGRGKARGRARAR
jgi:uncharacterized protein (DUF362 family)/Pyruvate/2-oxoacid:ferredoxin oxidoreductase delta subunit